jgi:hypothetical protein
VNLLPGVVFIALGALLIALAVAQRARRPAPIPVPVPPMARCGCDMPYCAHGVLPVGLGGPDLPAAELPAAAGHGMLAVVLPAAPAGAAEVGRERPELAELTTRVTRSCVSVYRGHEPHIRLVAVWRWSVIRRSLVADDRLDPSWSPEWSRELAERAWEAR